MGTHRTQWEQLADEILRVIAGENATDENRFCDLALRVFEFQVRNCSFLSRFAELTGSEHPGHYREIPALPCDAFKHADVRCFPAEQELGYFQTSGTTTGNAGRHHFSSFRLYEAAVVAGFGPHLLPDIDTMRMLILTPSPADAPHSSLGYMMQTVVGRWGSPRSRYLVRGDQLEAEGLLQCLTEAEVDREPVFLLGTALAFARIMDCVDLGGRRFQLPPGSRIMETGGFKGRLREIPRDEFYPRLSDAFGIATHCIVNEYGMTELSSQFYDTSLVSGAATDWKRAPHWTRVSAVDPLTGRPVADGETGLLRILDLANLGSSMAIQTEDVGMVMGDRFRVLGRHASASPRGCSLSAEEYQGLQER